MQAKIKKWFTYWLYINALALCSLAVFFYAVRFGWTWQAGEVGATVDNGIVIPTGSAWSWQDRFGTGSSQWKFEAMIIGIYFVLGLYLIKACRSDITKHQSLLAFTTWSHFVHMVVMLVEVREATDLPMRLVILVPHPVLHVLQALIDISHESRHLVPPGDVAALLLLFLVNCGFYRKLFGTFF